MTLYTRRQLTLLLLLVVTAGLGLAAQHWRAAHPELAARLEAWDRAPADDDERRAPAASPPRPADGARRTPGDGARDAPAAPGGAPATAPERVDLNRADLAALLRLPGMGRATAARLIAARERAGPFATLEEAGRAAGLRPAALERLRPLVSIAP